MIALLLQGIPEGVAITALAFVLCRIPLKLIYIVFVGVALAVFTYTIRQFPIFLGLHTILVMIMLFIVLTRLSKGDVGLSFISTLLSSLVLITFETAFLPLYEHICRLIPQSLGSFKAARIVLGEIHVFLLFVTAFLLEKFYFRKVS